MDTGGRDRHTRFGARRNSRSARRRLRPPGQPLCRRLREPPHSEIHRRRAAARHVRELRHRSDDYYYPYAVAVDSRGTIYVADRNNNRVVVRAPDGRPIGAWPTTGDGPDVGNPSALAIDAGDNVYVGGWQGNRVQRIQKLSPDGKVQATWPVNSDSPAQQSLTMGLGFDGQGSLFVTEVGSDRLRKLSAEGETVAMFGEPRTAPGQFRRPNNVAVDQGNNVYAVDWANERISVFDPSGQFKAQWGPYRDLQGVATVPRATCTWPSALTVAFASSHPADNSRQPGAAAAATRAN